MHAICLWAPASEAERPGHFLVSEVAKKLGMSHNVTGPFSDLSSKFQGLKQQALGLETDKGPKIQRVFFGVSRRRRRGRVRSIQTGKAYSPKFHRPSRSLTIRHR